MKNRDNRPNLPYELQRRADEVKRWLSVLRALEDELTSRQRYIEEKLKKWEEFQKLKEQEKEQRTFEAWAWIQIAKIIVLIRSAMIQMAQIERDTIIETFGVKEASDFIKPVKLDPKTSNWVRQMIRDIPKFVDYLNWLNDKYTYYVQVMPGKLLPTGKIFTKEDFDRIWKAYHDLKKLEQAGYLSEGGES